MLPLTPGMTMVAAAMTPTRNSNTTLTTPKLKSARSPDVSETTAIAMTKTKKSRQGIAMLRLNPLFLTFAVMKGRPPKIKPQKARFVGMGYVPSKNSNKRERATIAIPMPIKIGIRKRMLFLNWLARWVMDSISLS